MMGFRLRLTLALATTTLLTGCPVIFFTPGFVPLLGLACAGDVITSGTAQVHGVHKAHNMRAITW